MKRWGPWGRFTIKIATDRFMANVDINGLNGCHIWLGAKGGGGRYGSFGFQGQSQLAHRVAWKLFVGKIGKKQCICHKCDNGFCVNPEHLFIGTQGDNVHDMENKGRSYHKKGELHGRAKLTWADVQQMRNFHKSGMAIRAIARMYPFVDRNTVSNAIHGKTWSHQT